MIVGHLGLAYAARARWRRIPFAWLVAATMAPDLARLALDAIGSNRWFRNEYTHLLPWSLLLAAGLGLAAYLARRDAGAALVVGALVLSHVALDMISGRKPLWVGGPLGLDVQRYQQLELLIEATLLIGGWRLLRRGAPAMLVTRRTVLAALLLFETAYLAKALNDRPYATRCLEYPLQPCWKRRHEQPSG